MAFVLQISWIDPDRDVRKYPVVLEGIIERVHAPCASTFFSIHGSRHNNYGSESQSTFPQDARLINVHERYAVEYWSKKFRVTAAELNAAVAKVGVSVKAVEEELTRRRN